MSKRGKAPAAKPVELPLSDFAAARGRWRAEVQSGLGKKPNPRNRSGSRCRRSTRRKIGPAR